MRTTNLVLRSLTVILPHVIHKPRSYCQKPSHVAQGDSRLWDVSPSERVTFEPMPDGRVAIAAASPSKNVRVDPIAALRGSATRKMKTDAVMRLTRGEDWNKP